MNRKILEFLKQHKIIKRTGIFLLAGFLAAGSLPSTFTVIAADDSISSMTSQKAAGDSNCSNEVSNSAVPSENGTSFSNSDTVSDTSRESKTIQDSSAAISKPASTTTSTNDVQIGGGTSVGSSEPIPDVIHESNNSGTLKDELQITDIDGKAEVIATGADVLKSKNLQKGTGSSNSIETGSVDNVTSPYKSFNTEYGSIVVEFCGSNPEAANYKTDPDAGWKQNDLSLDTTAMSFSIRYNEVGTYSGKKIGAVAEYKVTPYKNINADSISTSADYGSGVYYPVVQVSDSLYSGWEWQNVKQFHGTLTFYYLKDDGSFGDAVVMGQPGTYESKSADYYIVNSLNPETSKDGITCGPEYVLPDDAQNAKAYCYDKDSYISNISNNYTSSGSNSENDNCSAIQYAYNGGRNAWEGDAGANGGTDAPENWQENSVMIMPQSSQSALGMTFGNLITTSSESGSKSESVPHTGHMWASLYTGSFGSTDSTAVNTVQTDNAAQTDNIAQADDTSQNESASLGSSSLTEEDQSLLGSSQILTSGSNAVEPEKGNKAYLSHSKTIDYLGDNEDNPDTTIDDPSSSSNLEDLYRLYLDASGKQEPIDLLLIVDRSGSMADYTIKQNGSTVTRSQAIVNLLTGQNGQENFINKFLSLNSSNKVAITWFAGYWEKNGRYTYDSYPFADLTGDEADAGVALDWTSASQADSIALTNGQGNSTGEIGGKESNGTDYTAGLWQAADTLKDTKVINDNHAKVVVFLSDGKPTHMISTGKTFSSNSKTALFEDYQNKTDLYRLGTGSENQRLINTIMTEVKSSSTDVMESIKKIKGLEATRFFSIAYASEINDVLKTLSPSNGNQGYSASDTASLLKALNDILVAAKATNAAVTDTLSENVDYYSDQPDLIVTKTNNSTQEKTVLYQNGKVTTDGNGIVESVAVSGKTVKLTFVPGFEMDNSYTYTISFNVKVTDTAYSNYKSGGYDSTGDSNTDYGTNTTSSGNKGFNSNSDAAFSYTTGGTDYSSPYDKPVVQVHLHDLSLIKKDDDGNVLGDISFSLYQADSSWKKSSETVYASGKTDGNGSLKFSNLRSGKYLLYETDTNDNLILPENPWRITVSANGVIMTDRNGNSIEKGNQDNSFVLVNNHKLFSLSLLKTDRADESKLLKNAVFSLFSNEQCTQVVKVYDNVNRTGEPITSFQTGDKGEVTIYGLRTGTYYLKETKAPEGYNLIDEAMKIIIKTDGTIDLGSTNTQSIELGNDSKTIQIKDVEIYVLPSTGGIGTYLFTISGVAVMITALLLFMISKRKEDAKPPG